MAGSGRPRRSLYVPRRDYNDSAAVSAAAAAAAAAGGDDDDDYAVRTSNVKYNQC